MLHCKYILLGCILVTVILIYISYYVESLVQKNQEFHRSLVDTVFPGKQQQQVLLYNRVPKTGSTSLMNILYELQSFNRYRVVQVRLTQGKHYLTLPDQLSFSRNISGWRDQPAVYHGHFAYLDLKADFSPIYINLVRKPLDRLVSYYYFLRYGDDVLKDKIRSRQGDLTTFDECVEKSQPDCDPKKLWMQIPFFCGNAPACWDPGSDWALSEAKHNLVTKYLVVGVTEDLESFVDVLEFLLPRFFHGAAAYLSESGKAHIKRTNHKDDISEATVAKMTRTKVYRLEEDFYNFALAHFAAVKKSVAAQRPQERNYYVYEKVRHVRSGAVIA